MINIQKSYNIVNIHIFTDIWFIFNPTTNNLAICMFIRIYLYDLKWVIDYIVI